MPGRRRETGDGETGRRETGRRSCHTRTARAVRGARCTSWVGRHSVRACVASYALSCGNFDIFWTISALYLRSHARAVVSPAYWMVLAIRSYVKKNPKKITGATADHPKLRLVQKK